jgi:hypothetical protein
LSDARGYTSRHIRNLIAGMDQYAVTVGDVHHLIGFRMLEGLKRGELIDPIGDTGEEAGILEPRALHSPQLILMTPIILNGELEQTEHFPGSVAVANKL